MREISKKLGKNLKRLRFEKGMSQGDIYRKIGMDRGYISSLESGFRNPTIANLEKIAKAIGVQVAELFK
ncbi:helix-turn-helix domain-containing protein [Patescibacteria group bacterium]|nr:helix-turn-helix domain-containing protein [Patescibacteria group bacterium]